MVGPELTCTGAIDWQAARGIEADLVQVMTRLERMRDQSRAKRLPVC